LFKTKRKSITFFYQYKYFMDYKLLKISRTPGEEIDRRIFNKKVD